MKPISMDIWSFTVVISAVVAIIAAYMAHRSARLVAESIAFSRASRAAEADTERASSLRHSHS